MPSFLLFGFVPLFFCRRRFYERMGRARETILAMGETDVTREFPFQAYGTNRNEVILLVGWIRNASEWFSDPV